LLRFDRVGCHIGGTSRATIYVQNQRESEA